MNIENELDRYRQHTRQSSAVAARGKRIMPGGISHDIRAFAPYPFAVVRAEGARLWDSDGNDYIDYWMGHYLHLFGHQPPFVLQALQSQLSKGVMWGSFNELEVQVAEKIVEMLPSAEMVRFCTSGTEATMYAVRLARGYTRRKLVLKMAGGWHGASTDLLHGVSRSFDEPESLGLPGNGPSPVTMLPFNDIQGSQKVIAQLGEQKPAAVIVEPMAGASWFIPASREYLAWLREYCTAQGVVLIFDEIITGFRVAPGGAQEYYHIVPDMTTLGKVMGAGMPIAAIAGKKEILNCCNPFTNKAKYQRVKIGGGTFSCHPLSLAASLALLNVISERSPAIYSELDEKGAQFKKQVRDIFHQHGIDVAVTGLGSLFTIHFPKEGQRAPRSPSEALKNCYYNAKEVLLKIPLINRGLYLMHGGGALSTAHQAQELNATLGAFDEVASLLGKTGDLEKTAARFAALLQ